MERYVRVPEGSAVVFVSQELAARFTEWTPIEPGTEVMVTTDPSDAIVLDVQVRQTIADLPHRARRHEPQTETR